MPFDPNLPPNNAQVRASVLRGQFLGLKEIIDSSLGVTDVVIDGVTTLNPGEPASATVSLVGTVLHLTLAIPRGDEGVQGAQGDTGAQGPPFANAIVDAVNTLPPGSAATVSVTFDGTDVHFTFGIPQGAEGLQGPPGEVPNLDGDLHGGGGHEQQQQRRGHAGHSLCRSGCRIDAPAVQRAGARAAEVGRVVLSALEGGSFTSRSAPPVGR